MVRAACWVLLVSMTAGAEQWADEPVSTPPGEPRAQPLVGPVVGAHLAMTWRSNAAPAVGARLGARLRVAPHVALALVGLWELESVFDATPVGAAGGFESRDLAVHGLFGLLRLEAFSVSSLGRVLVPELTVAAHFGAGRLFAQGEPVTGFRWGLSLGLTRLRPSGWWFPIFLELGQDWTASGGGASWHIVAGLGI